MNDTQKMLRAIINGQSTFRQEVMGKFKKVEQRFNDLEGTIEGVEKRLTKKIDSLGRQLAYLEDDTPTREEFDSLEKRVDNIEQKATSVL